MNHPANIPEWQEMASVEGLPLLGGSGRARVRLRNPDAYLLEVAYPDGVRSPNTPPHDSYIYLLSGHLVGTVGDDDTDLLPGDTLLHPAGVPPRCKPLATATGSSSRQRNRTGRRTARVRQRIFGQCGRLSADAPGAA